MHVQRVALLSAAAGLLLSCGLYGSQARCEATGAHKAQVPQPAPYFQNGVTPDPTLYLPPPPAAGTPRQQADDTAFAQTRPLKGSARWALAQTDAVETIPNVLKGFSCAAGFTIDAANAPHLVALLRKIGESERGDIHAGKAYWHRLRPFVGTHEAICTEDDRQKIAQSGAYPSGHTMLGWSTALVLAELLPDRSTALLQRGRVYGESRIVCGVHWASDVQEGYLMGAGEIAAMHGNAAFRADMEAARAEMAALSTQATQPEAQECAIEEEAARHSPL